ncbi:MAG: hypothetical protein WC329_08850 [Candidatus Omnitrophota bacterium]|jgi:chromosome segregation ATPase
MENNRENKLEQSINNLVTIAEELRKLSEELGVGGTDDGIRNQLSEAQWYLGEEKSRRQHLEQSLQEKENCIRQMGDEIHNLKQQLNETQWYLGEERARLQQLESRVKTS